MNLLHKLLSVLTLATITYAAPTFADDEKIPQPFSEIVTVEPIVIGQHNAFVGMTMVGEVIYIFYRHDKTHVSVTGNLWERHSSDYGQTWSKLTTLYTGEHLLIDYPEVLKKDPLSKADARDPRAVTSPDGKFLIVACFVTLAHQKSDDPDSSDPDDINRRHTNKILTVILKIPIIKGVPDFKNKKNSVVDKKTNSSPLTGTLFYHNDKLYTSTYGTRTSFFESADDGETWQRVGLCFQVPSQGGSDAISANESTTTMVGDTMVSIARPLKNQYGIYAKSTDNGRTWGDYANSPERLDGLHTITLNNGRVAVIGRKNSLPRGTYLYVFNSADYSQEGELFKVAANGYKTGMDRGYPSIIRHRDKFFSAWYDGELNPEPNRNKHNSTGVYFRQLNYDPQTYTFSYVSQKTEPVK